MAENLSPDPLAPDPRPAPTRNRVGEVAQALLIALILAFFCRTWILQVFEIPSSSMERGLLVGDQILVNNFIFGPRAWSWEEDFLPARPPRAGDVVVFRLPSDRDRFFVKRCVGVAGQKVEIQDKQLLVNETPLDETGYVLHSDDRVYERSLFLDDAYRKRDNFGPFFVPQHHYFCMGDNRDESNDSRFWGPVSAGDLKGRPVLVLWSKHAGKGGLRSLRPVR